MGCKLPLVSCKGLEEGDEGGKVGVDAEPGSDEGPSASRWIFNGDKRVENMTFPRQKFHRIEDEGGLGLESRGKRVIEGVESRNSGDNDAKRG